MACSSLRTGIVFALASVVIVGQANAASQFRLQNDAPVVVPVQDEENEEVWKDLRPDVTPPEAAVGSEGEDASSWEKAVNKDDCKEAGGVWDASANKCLEKK